MQGTASATQVMPRQHPTMQQQHRPIMDAVIGGREARSEQATEEMANNATASTVAQNPLVRNGRERLWVDTKKWMDAVCHRLQMPLEEAAAIANVQSQPTFHQWYATGMPHHVTRQLRVWVKGLLDEAKNAAAVATSVMSASSASMNSSPEDGGVMSKVVDATGGENEMAEEAGAGDKRERGRPDDKCKACLGMHRPHTCGKVGRAPRNKLWRRTSQTGAKTTHSAAATIGVTLAVSGVKEKGVTGQERGWDSARERNVAPETAEARRRLRHRVAPMNYKDVSRVIHRSQWNQQQRKAVNGDGKVEGKEVHGERARREGKEEEVATWARVVLLEEWEKSENGRASSADEARVLPESLPQARVCLEFSDGFNGWFDRPSLPAMVPHPSRRVPFTLQRLQNPNPLEASFGTGGNPHGIEVEHEEGEDAGADEGRDVEAGADEGHDVEPGDGTGGRVGNRDRARPEARWSRAEGAGISKLVCRGGDEKGEGWRAKCVEEATVMPEERKAGSGVGVKVNREAEKGRGDGDGRGETGEEEKVEMEVIKVASGDAAVKVQAVVTDRVFEGILFQEFAQDDLAADCSWHWLKDSSPADPAGPGESSECGEAGARHGWGVGGLVTQGVMSVGAMAAKYERKRLSARKRKRRPEVKQRLGRTGGDWFGDGGSEEEGGEGEEEEEGVEQSQIPHLLRHLKSSGEGRGWTASDESENAGQREDDGSLVQAGGGGRALAETYCAQCDRHFKTSHALLVHYATSFAHQNGGGSAVQEKAFCKPCNRWFKNHQCLLVHLASSYAHRSDLETIDSSVVPDSRYPAEPKTTTLANQGAVTRQHSRRGECKSGGCKGNGV